MAASACPSGNQDGGGGAAAAATVGSTENRGDSELSGHGLKHNPGLSSEWTQEDQSILEEGLAKYSTDTAVVRYAKIAMSLHSKTVRDVSLRCKWMDKKECGKRRKEDHNLPRKSKEKKEKVTDPSTKASAQLATRPGVPSHSLPIPTIDSDDDISYSAIGGSTGELLENNAKAFKQIVANFNGRQIQENIKYFCQIRDNIFTILNEYFLKPLTILLT